MTISEGEWKRMGKMMSEKAELGARRAYRGLQEEERLRFDTSKVII